MCIRFLIFALSVLVAGGCAVEDKQANNREKFLAETAPTSVTTLAEAKKDFATTSDVVVEGWADLKAFEEQQRAIFMVREILEDTDHGGDSGHDPTTCKFCARRMKAAAHAEVVFLDSKDDSLIEATIADLFDINHGDKVIVKGKLKVHKGIEGLDRMQIVASEIHIPAAK